MSESNGVTINDRRQIVGILNGILRQYYNSQFDHLLRRAKHYEARCFKLARDKQHYYVLVNEGIYKISRTYEHSTITRPTDPNLNLNPDLRGILPTPLTSQPAPAASAPLQQPSSVNDFLLSLGITPFPNQPAELPNPSTPNPSAPVPNSYPHLLPGQSAVPTVSRPNSSSSAGDPTPTQQQPALIQSTPPNDTTSPPETKSQKPRTPRAQTSAERSRSHRTRKRNAAKAGLNAPSPQLAPHQIAKAEQVPQELVSPSLAAAPHAPNVTAPFPQTNLGVLPNAQLSVSLHPNMQQALPQGGAPQHTNSQYNPDTHVLLSDGIHVPISQVYVSAASLGHRLTVDTIRRLSKEQILRLFLRARQVALSNVANVAGSDARVNNSSPQADPLAASLQNTNQPGGAQTGVLHHEDPLRYAPQQSDQNLLLSNNQQGVPINNVPMYSDTRGNDIIAANANGSNQHAQSQQAQFYGLSPQGFANQHVPQHVALNVSNQAHMETHTTPTELQEYTGMLHLPPSATFHTQVPNGNSNQARNSGVVETPRRHSGNSSQVPINTPSAIPTVGTPQRSGLQEHSLNVTQQAGIEVTPSAAFPPSSVDQLNLRLQRFQQKYRVYLKLVQDKLAAMKDRGNDGRRCIKYLRYAERLLVCPLSYSTRLSMDLVDKIESFLREFLVRYQGIAMERANTSAGSSAGVVIGSNSAPNMAEQVPSGCSPSTVQLAGQLGANPILEQPKESSNPEISHPRNVASSTPTSIFPFSNSAEISNALHPSPSDMKNLNQAAQQETTNIAIRAIEAQREAVAAAGIRQARASSNARTLSGRFEPDQILPAAAQNMPQPQPQAAPMTAEMASGVDAGPPVNIDALIAKSVSRVNHYVRRAVHSTDLFEKNLEAESLLRVKEERIAEVTYFLQPGKKRRAEDGQSSMENVQREQSLMDIVKQECEEAYKKHRKLIIGIDEEWNRPVVSCLLRYHCIRLPKLVVRVQGTYKRERKITFGFERPPFGWSGVIGDVHRKFKAIHGGVEGVREVLEAWAMAAEECLKDQ